MGTLCSQAKVNCLSPDQTSLSPSPLTPEMGKLQEQKESYPSSPCSPLLLDGRRGGTRGPRKLNTVCEPQAAVLTAQTRPCSFPRGREAGVTHREPVMCALPRGGGDHFLSCRTPQAPMGSHPTSSITAHMPGRQLTSGAPDAKQH